jgi:flagellar biosynthetic protein FlhB
MAENDSGQDKTEEATGKRKSEAREKGQIPRSKELTTLLMLLVGGSTFLFMGDRLAEGIMKLVKDGLTIERATIFDPAASVKVLADTVASAGIVVLPIFVVMVIAAIVAPAAVGGWSFSFYPLKPDLKKLDPIKGLGRVFSWKGLVELLKALGKVMVVGGIGYFIIMAKLPEFISLGSVGLEQAIHTFVNDLVWVFLLLSSTLIIIALVDVPFQLWDHNRKQKMTKQEVKDESKDTEGNPEVKSKLRAKQAEIAMQRMMQEVPKADVVVTNPTHYAVALKYDQERNAAPIVVALGLDEVAGHIRRVADANDVPILEAPPLARALYYSSELNKEIPAGLYLAVAQVLAYIYQLRHYQTYGGVAPDFNADVPIPDDLRRD